MTAFVLLIAMIPIDCEVQFFLILVYLLFLETIEILVNSQESFKKECPQTLFLQLPHPLINIKFACQ